MIGIAYLKNGDKIMNNEFCKKEGCEYFKAEYISNRIGRWIPAFCLKSKERLTSRGIQTYSISKDCIQKGDK